MKKENYMNSIVCLVKYYYIYTMYVNTNVS